MSHSESLPPVPGIVPGIVPGHGGAPAVPLLSAVTASHPPSENSS